MLLLTANKTRLGEAATVPSATCLRLEYKLMEYVEIRGINGPLDWNHSSSLSSRQDLIN